jgi:hypothetical protein
MRYVEAVPLECLKVGTPAGNKFTNSPAQNIKPFLQGKKPFPSSPGLKNPLIKQKKHLPYHPILKLLFG